MNILDPTLHVAIVILFVSLLMTLIRFVIGPSMPDRIISLDVFSANLLGILVIYAVLSGVRAYLSIALSFSLVTFVGSMTFAYYLIHQRKKKSR